MLNFAKRKSMVILLTMLSILTGLGGVFQPSQALASEQRIGVVDYAYVINQHPDTQKANDALKNENEAAKKQFDAKAAGLGAKEKEALYLQIFGPVEQKRQDLLKGIADKINLAVKEVAEAKGLSLVMDRNSTFYGGVDITEDVVKKIR